jgi:hypothetical protein
MSVLDARRVVVVGILSTSLLSCMGSGTGPIAPTAMAQPAATLSKILTDRRIWGEDALAVFASLDHWRRLQETSIIVFPDKVVSGTARPTREAAQQAADRLKSALPTRSPLRPEFSGPYGGAMGVASRHRVEAAPFEGERDFRVVIVREGGDFLKKDVRISTIMETYGKPEKTTTEVIHFRGDRRPAILTVYHYAGGAVGFVESDLAPVPGVVDRVVLDVAAVSAHIFTTPP